MILKVGLETHVSLNSNSKLFCDCTPGQQFCPICKGFPGFRPKPPKEEILNKVCQFLKILKSEPAKNLIFYRKNYLYHDLPNGFQRTQHPDKPAGSGGELLTLKGKTVPLTMVLLEEDPASTQEEAVSFKRAGSPLLEVVTKPIFQGTAEEVTLDILDYLKSLRRVCEDLNLLECSGVMKSDLNVSILGEAFRVEVKNLSSYEDLKFSLNQLGTGKILKNLKFNTTLQLKIVGGQSELIIARNKPKKYPFCRQTNLEIIKMNPCLESVETFPEIYQKLMLLDQSNHKLALSMADLVIKNPKVGWKDFLTDAENFKEFKDRFMMQSTPNQLKTLLKEIVNPELSLPESMKEVGVLLKSKDIFIRPQVYKDYLKSLLKTK